MAELLLRPFRLDDEPAAHAAQAELLADEFTFLLEDFDPGEPWSEYLARLDRISRGEGLAPNRVPADLLAADVDGVLVGRTSIRHRLNDHLALYGGHIGYGVRPGFRRRGYATRILELSLVRASEVGITSALVVCNDDNAGSAGAIEACGGVFDRIVTGEQGQPIRHYWVPTG